VLGAAQPWIGVWLWLFVVVQPTFVAVHKFESQVPLLFSAAAFVEAENVIMSGSDGARRIEVISPLGVGPLSRAAPVSVANPNHDVSETGLEGLDLFCAENGVFEHPAVMAWRANRDGDFLHREHVGPQIHRVHGEEAVGLDVNGASRELAEIPENDLRFVERVGSLHHQLFNEKIWAKIDGACCGRQVGCAFGFLGGPSGPFGSSDSGPERQRRYERSDEAKPKSGIGSSLSGIRSLPLGAKIAATLIVVWLAWLVMGRGLTILVERRRKMIEGLSYFVIGAALWFGSGVFWLG
jgi:hypothetical protein